MPAPRISRPSEMDSGGGLIYGRRMIHSSLYFLSHLLRPWRLGLTLGLGALGLGVLALFVVTFFLT